jgi:hypothetical protein
MQAITMVDVSLVDYPVKIDKVKKMILDGTWIFDRSGALIMNLVDAKVYRENVIIESFEEKDDRYFIETVIKNVDESTREGKKVPLLIINAGKIFGKFMPSRWKTRDERRDWEPGRKVDGERLNDLIESIQRNSFIEKCVIFNRTARPAENPFLKTRYPGSIDVLEKERIIDRVSVGDLLV